MKWFPFLLLAVLMALAPGCVEESTPTPRPTAVPTKTVSFKISAGDQYVVNLDMSAGSRLEFRFTSDLDINFQLLGPLRGAPLGNYPRVGQVNHEYVARDSGTHSLVFDNSFSLLTSKSVRLTYRVVPEDGR